MIAAGGGGEEAERATAKRLGVIGTAVWDTIHERDVREGPVEEWGGVGYTLEAFAAALPEAWTIVPILKVGSDLSERALRWLRGIDRLELGAGVVIVAEPNNRVELRYTPEGRRTERLTGGVPPWQWPELAPLLLDVDALYVNFISGFEMELMAAQALRARFAGPTYADLHSLFLGLGSTGIRFPRELPQVREWLRCFDVVQVNEDEFELMGRPFGDPWKLAAEAVGPELKLIAVTLGEGGAAYVAAPSFAPDPKSWPATRGRMAAPGTTRSARVPLREWERESDPTGCGDVWGAVFFSGLLAGRGLEEAMDEANRLASRNAAHRGAAGLRHHLLGRLPGSAGGET